MNMKLLFLSVLLVACVMPRMAMAAEGRIVFLGDSLTAGYGVGRDEAYPALIAQRIRDAGLEYRVVNAGASGDTTGGGLQRLERYFDEPIAMLVVELGVNDAFRRVPLARVRENLQAIIDRTRSRSPQTKIVLVGLEGIEKIDPEHGAAFSAIYPELAKKNGVALVPDLLRSVAGIGDLNLPDLIHPNAAGQKILAQNVWAVLDTLLRPGNAPR